jgi:predicted O-methyltransferase YrrM
VFTVARQVLFDRRNYYSFDLIEQRRSSLLKRKEILELTDLGAGGRKRKRNTTSIGAVTRRASVPKKYGKLLFRTVQQFKPSYVLELGSCVGIGSLYLSSAMGKGKFVTIEGDASLAAIASESLKTFPMSLPHVEVFSGPFDLQLPIALEKLPRIDLAFIDGNHQKEPTIQYFETIVKKCHEHSILIFDDIHWSEGMSEAWEIIKAHPRTRLTIDLHRIGMVFFMEDRIEVEHFMLYF